jgi:hypothetical protein
MIVGLLFGVACTGGKDRFAGVEADVRRSLALGTKVEDVARVLDSMGIGHSRLDPDSGQMGAIVRAVAKNLVTRTDAQFELQFDSAGKLVRIDAKRVLTGP